MRLWTKTLVATLAVGMLLATAIVVSGTACAADPGQPDSAGSQPEATDPKPTTTADVPALLPDEPDTSATSTALAGGLLMVGLAAFGLTLTFRSLANEIRGRRNRYRRRVRGEPRSADD